MKYDPKAASPDRWLTFLHELLDDADIPTLQEYLGYCLIPSTKGQKMMLIVGKGGEGKSRIGLVLKRLMGDAASNGSVQKVENNRFARADLERRLLMIDDDMDMNALPKTNYIKTIVTAEAKLDLERKGVQSYQRDIYARFLCFGNGALTSLYDHSDGFFRRQLILTTKDKPADRTDDPFLVEKMCAELEGILLWCLEGLHRLVQNDFRFTVSERAAANVDRCRHGGRRTSHRPRRIVRRRFPRLCRRGRSARIFQLVRLFFNAVSRTAGTGSLVRRPTSQFLSSPLAATA